jgi:hypothetical protein
LLSSYNTAIPTTPVASADNLFVAAAGNHMTSISISGQNPGWDDRTIGSPVYAQPIYYEKRNNNNVVLFPVLYFCERNGVLYQKDARYGTTYWSLDLTASAANVEADMAVSENGNLLFVGGTDGTLHAVRVATQPTDAPTLAPLGPPTEAPVGMAAATVAPTTGAVAAPTTSAVLPTGSPVAKPPGKEAPPLTTTATPVMAPAAAPPQNALAPAVLLPTGAVSNAQDQNNNAAKTGKSKVGVYLVVVGILLGLICCVSCFLLKRRRRQRRGGEKGYHRDTNLFRSDVKKSVASTPKTTISAADGDDNNDGRVVNDGEEKQLQDAYERECAENERMTLMELAESPIKMSGSNHHHQARSNRRVTSWDTASTNTPTHNTLTSIEEASVECADDKSGDDNKSHGYEVEVNLSISEHTMDESSLLDGVMSGAEDGPENLRRHLDKQKNKGGLATSLAESTDALAKAVGAAVAAMSTWDDKKGTDNVKSSAREVGNLGTNPQLRRSKSTGSDLSTPTQPGMIRMSSGRNRAASPSDMVSVDSSSIYLDEPSIHSADRVLKNFTVVAADVANADSDPKDCPEDEGLGVLPPGSAYLSRHNEKKDMDHHLPTLDGGMRSRSDPRDNGNNGNGGDRLQPMYNGVSVRPAGRSRAGIFSRRLNNNHTDDEEEDVPPPQPTTQKLPVKLGPKRSDILRSQKPANGEDNDGDEEEGAGHPQFTAHGYYEEPEEIANIVSLDSDDLPAAPAPVPAERGRRSSRSKKRSTGHQSPPSEPNSPNSSSSSMRDPWGSFLSELSKVENTFFSTNGLLSAAGRSSSNRNNNAAAEEDDDAATGGESNNSAVSSAPPPAPRTFYA